MATITPTQAPSIIATLATGEAIEDLRILLFSLALFNPRPPKVYLYCDERIADTVAEGGFKYPGTIIAERAALAPYAGLNRAVMEQMKGKKYPSLWFDFMAEKIGLLRWAFAQEARANSGGRPPGGILFCDADICFLGPLPQIPATAQVALSPHYIRDTDEARYGQYNGGFAWFATTTYVEVWERACATDQRFYEQSALEDVADAATDADPKSLFSFPPTQNFGWWRLWQGKRPPSDLQRAWTMNRAKAAGGAGILIDGVPLGSVHTHFMERHDTATVQYNLWVQGWLHRLAAGHPPARRLLNFLTRGPTGAASK
jgi:hypothetical protein